MSDRIGRFVTGDLQMRASIVEATQAVRHLQSLQPIRSDNLTIAARAMMGSLLMASHLKEGQLVGVLMQGADLAFGSVFAEASAAALVRAFVQEPMGHFLGQTPLGFSQSYLTVTRTIPFQKQPYQGTVELVTGNVQDDLVFYLLQSQQIRSLMSLEVVFGPDGQTVDLACGMLIEVMPGVEQKVFDHVVMNAREVPSLSQELMQHKGKKFFDLLSPYFKSSELVELDHPYKVEYGCRCDRNRVETMLSMLGTAELESMRDEGETVEVRCQMCSLPYFFTVEQLEDLVQRISPTHHH